MRPKQRTRLVHDAKTVDFQWQSSVVTFATFSTLYSTQTYRTKLFLFLLLFSLLHLFNLSPPHIPHFPFSSFILTFSIFIFLTTALVYLSCLWSNNKPLYIHCFIWFFIHLGHSAQKLSILLIDREGKLEVPPHSNWLAFWALCR